MTRAGLFPGRPFLLNTSTSTMNVRNLPPQHDQPLASLTP